MLCQIELNLLSVDPHKNGKAHKGMLTKLRNWKVENGNGSQESSNQGSCGSSVSDKSSRPTKSESADTSTLVLFKNGNYDASPSLRGFSGFDQKQPALKVGQTLEKQTKTVDVRGAMFAAPSIESLNQDEVAVSLKRFSPSPTPKGSPLRPGAKPPKSGPKSASDDPLITLRLKNIPENRTVENVKSILSRIFDVECTDVVKYEDSMGAAVLPFADARRVLLNLDKLSQAGSFLKVGLSTGYRQVFLRLMRLPNTFSVTELGRLFPLR